MIITLLAGIAGFLLIVAFVLREQIGQWKN